MPNHRSALSPKRARALGVMGAVWSLEGRPRTRVAKAGRSAYDGDQGHPRPWRRTPRSPSFSDGRLGVGGGGRPTTGAARGARAATPAPPDVFPIPAVGSGSSTTAEALAQVPKARAGQQRRRIVTEQEIEAKVIELIAQQMNHDKAKITREMRFAEDLEADSLDQVELVMELEDEFETNIPDEVAEKIKTVGDAIDFIKQNCGQK